MKLSSNGLSFIASFEGCRLTAYRDVAGVLTIGYGHTGKDVKGGQRITQAEAFNLLNKDAERFVKAVNDLVKVPLNQNQFDALVSFSFNVGSGALQKSDLLKKLNAKDYAGASKEFSRWNKATIKGVLTVVSGLTRRRNAESELFLKPAITGAPKPVIAPKPKFKAMDSTSIVDFLKANNIDSSLANRTVLATKHGIKNYTGTAVQNTSLLAKIKQS